MRYRSKRDHVTPLDERIKRQVVVTPSGCWQWTSGLDRNGYGVIGVKTDGRWVTKAAHRISYEVFVGPIPDGLQIDHVLSRGCVLRSCVNPDHLEPVTQPENRRRAGDRFSGATTHCVNGHAFTPENTRLRQGKWRECRACGRNRATKRREHSDAL